MLFTATVLTFRKMYMAGTLWKWTNYFSGWQERWFVLDNGILSYYKTQDDVNTGCKGSVKMSVCDIAVHPTDSLRLDLIIPGEQHFYVRASNPKERQEWLVALGSTKASMGQLHEKSGNNSKDLLKTKRSELRLYCDLLMQQMHSLKVAVSDKEVSSQRLDEVTSLVQPTCDMFLRTLGECMDLVQTVGHSMETAHSPITDAALLPSPHKSANKKSKSLHRQYSNERHSRSPSVSSTDTMYVSRSNSFTQSMQQTTTPPSAKSSPKSRTLSDSETMLNNTAGHERSERTGSFSDSSRQKITSGNVQLTLADSSTHQLHNISESISQGCDGTDGQGCDGTDGQGCDGTDGQGCDGTDVSSVLENGFSQTSQGVPRSVEGNHSATEDAMSDTDVFVDPIEARVPTFFSIMPVSMVDLKLEPDGGIPVETFLEACQNVLPIFDKFNTTAFAPVKMDFQGNIRKVRTKFSTDPALFHSLQNIVLHEISKKQQYNPSSATMALLWMKRSLQFICGFLEGIKQGEDDLSVAASNAYSGSLKPYHGWVVRGVFAVAAKALPYRSVFLPHLNPSMVATDTSAFQTSLMVDIEAYCDASKVVVDILDDFFASNHLNVEEPV